MYFFSIFFSESWVVHKNKHNLARFFNLEDDICYWFLTAELTIITLTDKRRKDWSIADKSDTTPYRLSRIYYCVNTIFYCQPNTTYYLELPLVWVKRWPSSVSTKCCWVLKLDFQLFISWQAVRASWLELIEYSDKDREHERIVRSVCVYSKISMMSC